MKELYLSIIAACIFIQTCNINNPTTKIAHELFKINLTLESIERRLINEKVRNN